MPSWFELWVWRKDNEEFASAYDLALEHGGHSLFFEALEAAREMKEFPKDSVHVRATEGYLSHLRWAAGKLAPKAYSEKAAGQMTVPIQIVTSLNMGQDGAGERPPDRDAVYNISATIELPPEPVAKEAVENGKRAPTRRTRVGQKGQKV